MTVCKYCGETIPDDAHFCPYCGNGRPAEVTASDSEEQQTEELPDEVRQAEGLPDEAQQAEALSDEDTADSVEDAVEDDGWRPYRYQRRAKRTRANSRTRQPDRQTLRLLAGWLAALIVIAGGIFWYIWSENETQPQTAPLMAVITAEQR